MGGAEKCLLPLGDGVILDAILQTLSAQVYPVLLNSNCDAALFARFGLALLPDAIPTGTSAVRC